MAHRKWAVALSAVSIVALLGGAATTSFSADDPIKARKELMKSNGKAAKALGDMLKGDVAFDAAKAEEAAKAIAMQVTEFGGLFPDTSKEGGETEASPKIWEAMDDFKVKVKALADDATAAAAAATAGEADFKAAAGKMFGNCKSCHEVYRIQKQG